MAETKKKPPRQMSIAYILSGMAHVLTLNKNNWRVKDVSLEQQLANAENYTQPERMKSKDILHDVFQGILNQQLFSSSMVMNDWKNKSIDEATEDGYLLWEKLFKEGPIPSWLIYTIQKFQTYQGTYELKRFYSIGGYELKSDDVRFGTMHHDYVSYER